MRVVLGITGSIAAYKGLIFSRELYKRGIKQKVILTYSALKFIKPLSFKSITDADVYTPKDFFNSNLHIEIARWGDVLIVLPASANFISKLANGIADSLLLSVSIAFNKRIIIVPAMHEEMWDNRFLRENIEKLRMHGVEILGPTYGMLSSGEYGMGRMVEIDEVLDYLFRETKKVLLIYGRTEEPIDDVRVITNRSSGRMGYLIHLALENKGIYHDIVVCGNVEFVPKRQYVKIYKTIELLNFIKESITKYDVLIMPVAISDFVVNKKEGKLHRKEGSINLELKPNIDVLAELSKFKNSTIFIGFSLESRENLEVSSANKIKEKNLDYVVANTIESIDSENITGFIMDKNFNKIFEFENLDKFELAKKIVNLI
ncbi:MAG: bifunctional phosphopantothenoylcysteine decarboxylase/phosphopantothenate--cysteine ligase CoaBC [candidate division WOR-3 bacterium]|nr:bifunctional phosphopantothenoylcysteine decarboxylase/phosphopantothenate--cysteine ligase CoaBC [candidate division WOR-3 bacterium]MCX7948336.1 bifunctional phosphopantothenoylcysteine decarboxylase/phosphopantothenate--cysteine ligase CoaBC [candidate division WOR-3 bacterium]MDW8150836.1 bifunctional phosphopantothenoylcysteine decarboxylase/phosphopantothenate--cysteine ligase CoaBC [candidate division WOR-3 bacterium]